MSGLRFAMVTTFYPPHNFGGDGIAVQRLTRALARHGHHVTVIHDVDAFDALREGPEPAEQTEPEGVEVVRLRSRLRTLSPLLTQQLGRPIVHGARIRRILDEGEFDVVNFHNVSLVGGPGILSAGSGIKLYTAHEHWLVCPTHVLWRHNREVCTGRECLRCTLHYKRPPQAWRYTGLLERQLRHVDAFIAMSEFSRRKHREFGFEPDMEVIPGFLPDHDGPAPDAAAARPHARPYFLFVGRLGRIKGLDDVIPAFERYPHADLLIAGEGDHGDALRALAAGNPRVRFVGSVPPDALRAYYAHALALLVPSVGFETFGLVLIEAFREGTPVIARRLGPFPEIVEHHGAGELFATEVELVAALERMQFDDAARRRMAEAARVGFLESWSETPVLGRYLDLVRRTALSTGRAHIADALAAGVAA